MPKQNMLIAIAVVALAGLVLIIIIFRMNNSSSTPLASTSASTELCQGPLAGCAGKMVKVSGAKSDLMQQHRGAGNVPYFNTSYLDVLSEGQIALYTKEPITLAAGTKLTVTGQVIKVGGDNKPGTYEAENEVPPEYQIVVESWQELK